MNNLNERIKYLRKNILNLTQVEFGKRIGIAGTTVTGWEKRNMKPSETAIKAICAEFDVSYAWLVDGLGDIFIETDRTTIELLAKDYDLRPVEVALIEEYVKLDEKQRDVLINYLENVFVKNGQ